MTPPATIEAVESANGPVRCYVLTDSYAGRCRHDGEIVGETPTKYRVKFDRASFGRPAGDVRLIPKKHVRFDSTPQAQEQPR